MIGTSLLGTFGGEAIVIVAIVVLLYVVFKLGKGLVKMFLSIIVNSVLGIATVYLSDVIFGLGIPFKIYTLIPLALFGLPAAGTLIILRFFGIPL